MHIANVERGERSLAVTWADQSLTEFPFIWLRENDRDAFHPDTRERTLDLTTVAPDICPESIDSGQDKILIQWPTKPDVSAYTGDWLYRHRPGHGREDPARVGRNLWDANSLGTVPAVRAADCAASPAVLKEALLELKSTGLLIFSGMDDNPHASETLGNLIGFRRQTNFGIEFEVVSKPDPNNLAYTSLALPLHTDLPNQEAVPGFQFLHSYRNDAAGGDSVFADGFRICDDLAHDNPEDFALLGQTPIPWRFHDEDWDIRQHRSIINVDAAGNLQSLVFNAHIADLPDMAPDVLHAFYPAYRRLMVRIRDPRYAIHYSLSLGEMVAFDNRRVLHGRTAFDAESGDRHFHGYYIEQNEIDSRIRVLSRNYPGGTPCP